ncbi:chemotaxis protein CheW [Nostoc sp. UCD121]|uniref:chemotaxis protein CheW n=1 Tax=unclassified Nostoc TaxID=2593658 RepID=UPI001625FB93|nr:MULTISPECIES: chemotaxis protein CheW [unclassified Nostoc]MBC1224892.1 chemotaxis protein CheW [Nostoc sp. UCD120]MBC1279017.1 chemotaxis protein CheW [Nostoc sp. UCD121]MBC1297720.1 chemotaxis protein CheW [Nostoc sp. UCD122]
MSTDFVPQPQNDDPFLEEAIDLLLFLEQELPNYTKDSNPGTALALMEAAHSLNSIAIAAELDAIAIVAAALEEIFQLLHQYRATVNAPIASLLSEGLDCLQMLLMAFLTASQIDEVEILERMSAIVARLQAEFGGSQQTNLETSLEQPQEHQPVIQFGDHLTEVEFSAALPEQVMFKDKESLDRKQIDGTSSQSGSLVRVDTEQLPIKVEELTNLEEYGEEDFHAWLGDFSLPNETSVASLVKSVRDRHPLSLQESISTILATSIPTATPINIKHLEQLNALIATLLINYNQQACQEEQQKHTIGQLLRQVKRLQHLLDNLQEWSGRLAAISDTLSPLAASRSQQLYSTLQSVLAEASQVESTVDSLNNNHHQLKQELLQQEKLLNHSANLVKKVTTIPLKVALEPLHRLWSQLQALQDKSAKLHLQISDIQVDRAFSDRLHALLLHISCYLLEQSIESSQTRQHLGKNSNGIIEIQVYQQGNQLIIDGCDDGTGLNLSQIYQQALAQGLALTKPGDILQELVIEPEVSSVLCDRAALELGVELTEVCKQLTAIQGRIVLKSKAGHGTAFSLQIPLDQKIAQLIVCQANSRVYAFIADSVEQIYLSQSEQIIQTQAGRMLLLQSYGRSSGFLGYADEHLTTEMLVPIHLLTDVLICPSHLPTSVTTYSTYTLNAFKQDKPLLVFRYLDKRCALEVDCIIGKQSSAIHPLGEAIPVAAYIQGTSIVANGQLSLVLDGQLLTKSLT